MSSGRFVVKRDGRREKWSFDKITRRIALLCDGLEHVEPELVTQTVVSSLKNDMTTAQIDVLSAEICDNLLHVHPQYRDLAGRILVSNNHKNTSPSFVETTQLLHHNVDRRGREYLLFSGAYYSFVTSNAATLDAAIDHSLDFRFNYIQFRTFEDTYAIKKREYVETDKGVVEKYRVVERPQYMWMRVAIQVNGYEGMERVLRTYRNIAEGYYTHATPTVLNSGFQYNSCISCYLDIPRDDSIDEIYKLNDRCAKHSKGAGGIGFDVSNIRSKGAEIRKSGGKSNGLVPMLKVFNETANYVDQCFHPSTRVLTINGYRAMDTLQQNDRVLTHDGSFQPITRVLNGVVRGDETLMRIHVNTGNLRNCIFMTKNHPMLCIHNKGALKHTELMEIVKAEYVASEEVLVGDYLVVPIPTLEYPQEEYSTDDLEMYVMLIMGKFVMSDDFSTLYWSKKDEMTQFVKQYIVKNFIEYYEDDECIKMYPTKRFKFTKAMLFANGTMYIHSKLLHCATSQVEVMVKQVVRLGGFKPVVRSLEVAEGIYYWFMRMGVLIDFEPYNDFARTANNDKYVLYIPPNVWDMSSASAYTSKYHFKCGSNFYTQVRSVEEAHYQGAVYDLEVNKNKNYVTEMGVVHNGGGKRKGSFAVYVEPWHGDILDVIDAMGVQGDDRKLTRDLFFALWMNDLFMERLEKNEMWSLMCPDSCPNLYNVYGDEFRQLYEQYEREKLYKMQIPAKELYMRFAKLQIERGRPYVVFKDWSNMTSNQKNIGVVRSSNLCAEIIEVANEDYTACCNLASIALPRFVRRDANVTSFDFAALIDIAKEVTINLNNVIDHNYYVTPDTQRSNMAARPIAIGIQGLADVFAMMKLPFASEAAIDLDRKIYEHIYYGALSASVELAKRDGAYQHFQGSPFSKGILQFDYYGDVKLSPELDWAQLRRDVVEHGTRNSLLTASMPTASTALLLGNNECFEPYPSMLMAKSNKTARFLLLNKYFVEAMTERGLWNEDMFMRVKANEGYISDMTEIPKEVRDVFMCAYELPQKVILDHAVARQPFIDQSQSMNLFFSRRRIAQKFPNDNPDAKLIAQMYMCLMYAWKHKLKTGVYYTRTEAATTAQKVNSTVTKKTPVVECTDEVCFSCSS